MNIQNIVEAVQTPLVILLFLSVGDLLLGAGIAIKQKRFELERLGDVVLSNGLMILVWLIFAVLGTVAEQYVPDVLEAAPAVVYGLVAAKIAASIMGHAAALGVLTNAVNTIGVKPTGKTEESGRGG